MLEGKGFMDKLRREAGLFKGYMREKRYPEAKYCYDSVLAALVLMEADRETMREFFGERGGEGRHPEGRAVPGMAGAGSLPGMYPLWGHL